MKKTLIIVFSIILMFILSFYIGTKISSSEGSEVQEISEVKEGESELSTVTSGEEETISPNAFLTLKTYYNACDHTKEETTTIPTELVNLNKSEVQEKYRDWKLEKFNKNQIVLMKNESGICGEHYELKEKDGYIIVYNLDEHGEESLYMATKIAVEYLPQTDKHALEKGIYLYGKEDLNEILQDFE